MEEIRVGEWLRGTKSNLHRGKYAYVLYKCTDNENARIRITAESPTGETIYLYRTVYFKNNLWEPCGIELDDQDRHDIKVLAVDLYNKSLFEME